MVLSLGVVGAAIAVFVLLLPRSAHQKVTPVSYLPAAAALAKESALPILVPQPLPSGWQASYVRIDSAPDGLHIGFVLDSKRFARLDETAKPSAAFYKSAYVNPSPTPAQPADATAGVPAGFEVRRGGKHVALLRHLTGGGVLTISDGGTSSGASLSELAALARSLREQVELARRGRIGLLLGGVRTLGATARLAHGIEPAPGPVQPLLTLASELLAALPQRQRFFEGDPARLQPAHDVFEFGAGLLVGLRQVLPCARGLAVGLRHHATTSTSRRPSARRTASRSPPETVDASRTTAPSGRCTTA